MDCILYAANSVTVLPTSVLEHIKVRVFKLSLTTLDARPLHSCLTMIQKLHHVLTNILRDPHETFFQVRRASV